MSSADSRIRDKYPRIDLHSLGAVNSINWGNSMHWPSTSFSVLIILLISFATDILGPFLGAIVASAPTGTPLALYLSTANSNNAQSQQLSLTTATEGLVVGSFCTLLFAIATNQAAKSGLSLFPTLLSGYLVWFITYSIVKRVSSSS